MNFHIENAAISAALQNNKFQLVKPAVLHAETISFAC